MSLRKLSPRATGARAGTLPWFAKLPCNRQWVWRVVLAVIVLVVVLHLALSPLMLSPMAQRESSVYDTASYQLGPPVKLKSNPPFDVEHQGNPIMAEHPEDGSSELALSNLDTSLPMMRDRCSAIPALPARLRRIPNIVHFIFGLRPDFGMAGFGLVQYVALKSARMRMRADKIYLHYGHLPDESKHPWWKLAQEEGLYDELVHHEPVMHVFGNKVEDVSHKADILRLQILMKYGGIYLDMDVVTLKPFTPLLHHDFLLGQESWGQYTGLANAIILTTRDSDFLKIWWDSYRTFDDGQWSYHSVLLPVELAKKHPEKICVLHPLAFFYPAYFGTHMDLVHYSNEWDFDNEFQYAYHVYSHSYLNMKTRANVTELRKGETSFARLIKPFLPEDPRFDLFPVV